MSLGGSLVILAIALARLLLQNRVHRTVWLVLWAVAVLRLLAPFTVGSASSIFNLPVFTQQTEQTVTEQTVTEQPIQPAPPVTQAQPIAVQTVTELPTQNIFDFRNILFALWLTGAAVTGGYFILSHAAAKRRYRFSIPIELPQVPERVSVRELEGLTSPLTYGILHPVILLPCGMQEQENCSHILAHELAHIRHGDVAYKAVLLLTAAVHWFNPFVWLMLYMATQDMEMRCDAEAIKTLNGARTAYAKTLIAAEETKLRGYLQTGFSFSSTEQRLRAIVRGKASRALSICVGVLLPLILIAVFCTGQLVPQAQAAAEETVLQTETATEPTEELLLITETAQAESATEPPEPVTEVAETTLPSEPETTAPAATEPTEVKKSAEPTEPAVKETGSNSYDAVVTVQVGKRTSIYLYVADGNYPTAANTDVVHVIAAYGGFNAYECVIQGCKVGSTVVSCTGIGGTYRVLVYVVEPPKPNIDTGTELAEVPTQPDYAALIPNITEEEP